MSVDIRHKIIGGRHRALSRYHMILYRVNNTDNPRNKGYSGVKVLVSKNHFCKWFMDRDFRGCNVDRIDKNGHYELSNMQLLTFDDHMEKDKTKMRDGWCVCWSCKDNKPIDVFSKDRRRKNGYSTICKVCDRKRYNIKKGVLVSE